MKHYVAGVAVIVRESDNLMSTKWGIRDTSTGLPVYGDGPVTGWNQPHRAGRPALQLWDSLDDAGHWIAAHGGGLLVASGTASRHPASDA